MQLTTTWYSKNADGSLAQYTFFEADARRLGLVESTTAGIHILADGRAFLIGEEPEVHPTIADYDAAMESHLDAEKAARGYTKREPSDYAGSSNARWAQDAADWIAHRDEVMEYALEVENAAQRGEPVPTLEQFVSGLPLIQWTIRAMIALALFCSAAFLPQSLHASVVKMATEESLATVSNRVEVVLTNAIETSKSYTDSAVQQVGSITPSIVTNISYYVTTNVVTKTYVKGLGIEAGISGDIATNIVDGIVASSNLATVAALDGKANVEDAYPATSGNQLASQVSTIGAHLNAEDARFVSTNYNSATHMPEAYVEIKLTNNTWSTIWREMTRFNWLINTYLPINYASKSELDEKADRAWGYYDSHTGSYAPDGYTWLSSPRIAIAAGLAYQRTVTSEGAVWVLESNGLVTQTVGETNGFFRITDEEGNTQFEIVKGNKRTIGADASSCQVVAGFSPTKLQIGYSISSDTHPTIEVTGSLSSPSWKSETDADCLANVTWSGSSGEYVAQVQAKTDQPSLFVRATYQSGGETYINNAAPVALNYLYLGGVKYAVSTNTISGHLVLTLTPSL